MDDQLAEFPVLLYEIDGAISDYLLNNRIRLPVAIEYDFPPRFMENIENIEVSVKDDSGFHINSNFCDYISSISDLNIRLLVCCILENKDIRMGPVKVDESLEDPIMPNEWVYHKDLDMDFIKKYVVSDYDSQNQDDEDEWP